MNTLSISRFFTVVLTALSLSLFVPRAQAGEFSAEMVQRKGGREKGGSILVKGERYRLQMEQGGHQLHLIVDPGTRKAHLVAPAARAYAELEIDHFMVLMNDPFQASARAFEQGSVTICNKEDICGYACTPQVLRLGGQTAMTRWVSDELGFTLKIVAHEMNEAVTELFDFREQVLPDALFAVPEHFEMKSLEELRQAFRPREGGAGDSAAKQRALGWLLQPGDRWSLQVVPGAEVVIDVDVFGGGEASWSAQPFLAGEPLAELQACTHPGQAKITLGGEEACDAVRMSVAEGELSMRVTLKLADRDPLVSSLREFAVKAGSSRSGTIKHPYQEIRVTITADQTGRNTAGSFGVTRGPSGGGGQSESFDLQLDDGEEKVFAFTMEDSVNAISTNIWRGGVALRLEETCQGAAVPEEAAPQEAAAPEPRDEGVPVPGPERSPEAAPGDAPIFPEDAPVINVLAASEGTFALFVSSQYDTGGWAAKNLIDGELGSGHEYCSRDDKPQDIVFELPRLALVSAVEITAFTSESENNWARAFELWGSATSAHAGFEKLTEGELPPLLEGHVFAFEPRALRWVSLRPLSSHGGSYIELAEVALLGRFALGDPVDRRVNLLAADGGTEIVHFDSQYDSEKWAARNLIDGKVGSGHEYCSANGEPQEIVFALPVESRIGCLAFNPATDDDPGNWAREVELLLSSEGPQTGFSSVGAFTLNNRRPVDPSRYPPDQEFLIQPTTARFVKLRLLSNHGGSYIEMGEVRAYAAED